MRSGRGRYSPTSHKRAESSRRRACRGWSRRSPSRCRRPGMWTGTCARRSAHPSSQRSTGSVARLWSLHWPVARTRRAPSSRACRRAAHTHRQSTHARIGIRQGSRSDRDRCSRAGRRGRRSCPPSSRRSSCTRPAPSTRRGRGTPPRTAAPSSRGRPTPPRSCIGPARRTCRAPSSRSRTAARRTSRRPTRRSTRNGPGPRTARGPCTRRRTRAPRSRRRPTRPRTGTRRGPRKSLFRPPRRSWPPRSPAGYRCPPSTPGRTRTHRGRCSSPAGRRSRLRMPHASSQHRRSPPRSCRCWGRRIRLVWSSREGMRTGRNRHLPTRRCTRTCRAPRRGPASTSRGSHAEPRTTASSSRARASQARIGTAANLRRTRRGRRQSSC
jgi:hypothetical protein